MRTKFVQGREVLDPYISEEEIESTEHIFGLTPEELKLINDVVLESVESSKTSSEFISKIVESASAENTGWNFIMGFACGKLIEGMNTAAVISAMKQNRHRTKDVLSMPVEPDDKTDAERLGYIG